MKIRDRAADVLSAAHDIYCGLHSGIPWHCVAWFTLLANTDPSRDRLLRWNDLVRWARRQFPGRSVAKREFNKKAKDLRAFLDAGGIIGHVQCPWCVVTRQIQTPLHRCGCHGGSIFRRAAKYLVSEA